MIKTQREIDDTNYIISELDSRFEFTYNLFEDSILWNYINGSREYKLKDEFIRDRVEEFESEVKYLSSFTIKDVIKYLSINNNIMIQYLESLEEWNPNDPSEIKKVLSGLTVHDQTYFERQFENWFLSVINIALFKEQNKSNIRFKYKRVKSTISSLWFNKVFHPKINELYRFTHDYSLSNERYGESKIELHDLIIKDIDESLDFETDRIYSEALYRVLKQNNQLHLYSWYSHSENIPKRRFIEV